MELPDLPVRAVLPDIVATLSSAGCAVLVAPPGTGKTTLVPLALPGRVVVAEPRRLAARAAAARMAALLGEPVGRTVGYSVRGDRKVSRATRIEVVTSGLLVRRLQNDPELSGVDTVLLDECHERHLDADLLLALLLDARAGLRPDLSVLATSATVAAQRLAALLGDAPVLSVAARTYSTVVSHVPPVRGEQLAGTVVRAVRSALSEVDGDVLVFLPGVGEINRVAAALDVDTVVLHGRLGSAAQDLALRPGPRQRVVLATSIAESSLTVPGVRAVVDSGLARVPRVDHRRGLSGLATVRVSAAVADQRAGRAGREAPGRVYRCWPAHEHATLPRYPEPEIRTADLTRLALELACWGTPDGAGLAWWDAPPAGALSAGREVLLALGALDSDGATSRGRRMAQVGLHPRLARALLDGAPLTGARTAAEVVALLDDSSATSTDLVAALRSDGRWRREARRLEKLVSANASQRYSPSGGPPDSILPRDTDNSGAARNDPALIVALAYPERIARRRTPGSPVYLMAGGTAVEAQGFGDAEWLAIATADREPGRTHGKVRLAARADEQLARTAAPALIQTEDVIAWDGDVKTTRQLKLGAIVLEERPIKDPAATRQALKLGLEQEGISLLNWTEEAKRLRTRLDFLHRTSNWPEITDEHIIARIDLSEARKRSDLAKIDAKHVLRQLLPWPEASQLDEKAPDQIVTPNGRRAKVDYTGDGPQISLKLQDAFGWRETPRINGIPATIHLLSPAGRPAAVTSDLKGFWQNGYLQVRKELKGRYPKHDWPAYIDPT
ncbi:ATP-dependent helicase [Lentzea sp. NBRC 105346]|uniref:ATP-dependent helicase HrpB n=1 Tax=Lentzea sp. NBRC 105346 TaxID=3032205 RepID=UPI0024A5DA69|nr:ATP-dependent helicase HrpB [Lentzea sp. NBRC 105346]GLZ30816.1 ATP-dependent helicase [Lentzea sp. NBRC 105346]